MAVEETIQSATLLWNTWSVHGFVVLSLSLQIFLFLAAPFRKKTSNVALVVSVWSAYLLVNTAIDRSLALIYSTNKQKVNRAELVDLYILWSTFMPVYFGGADTITALAVEDNKLWRRSFLYVTTLISTVFIIAFSVRKTLLLWPNVYICSLLILLAGILKSAERILSLANASFESFEWSVMGLYPNPGPDYAAIMEEHDLYKKAGVPVKFDQVRVDPKAEAITITSKAIAEGGVDIINLSNSQLVEKASYFFNKYKGMYVDMVFYCHDRNESRELFLHLSPRDAFCVLETEMKLAYEAFYTKTTFISSSLGKFSRWVAFLLQLVALLLWSLQKKNSFRPAEVKITYILLVGAILIDVASYFWFRFSFYWFPDTADPEKETRLSRKFPRLLVCQWSESISKFNFVDYCIYERPEWQNKLFSLTGAKEMMDGWWYVSEKWLTNRLRYFITEELKGKSMVAEDLDIGVEVSSSRGTWVLRLNAICDLDPTTFEPWITGVKFDVSLLTWHIATELCYQTDESEEDENQHRQFSKILSDYMLYLLLRQPKLMFEIAPMAEIVFQDTSEQAKQFFHNVMASSLPNAKDKTKKSHVHTEACRKILEVRTELSPSYNIGESKSVLFDACRLAKCLKELKTKGVDQWRFTSQIWVELLCYAAAQSPARAHVTLLSSGGELVTLVRLLMLHLGLSNQFRKAKTIRRLELVVGDSEV